MRERATKIEELKKQLKVYEDMHDHPAQDPDRTFQESSSGSPSPSKRGTERWSLPNQPYPSVPSSRERHQTTFSNDLRHTHVQRQGHAAPVELPWTRSPGPTMRQQTDYWEAGSSSRHATVEEPIKHSSSLSIDGGISSDGMPPLSLGGSSTTAYDDFAFDTAGLMDKGQVSISLLHMAVAGSHIDTVKVLLQDERVVVDDEDSEGFTPLQRAVMQGKSEIVKLLLEHSANPKAGLRS